jgi:hypothetical protein
MAGAHDSRPGIRGALRSRDARRSNIPNMRPPGKERNIQGFIIKLACGARKDKITTLDGHY